MRLFLLPLLLLVVACDDDDDRVVNTTHNTVVVEDCRDNPSGPDCPDLPPQ